MLVLISVNSENVRKNPVLPNDAWPSYTTSKEIGVLACRYIQNDDMTWRSTAIKMRHRDFWYSLTKEVIF